MNKSVLLVLLIIVVANCPVNAQTNPNFQKLQGKLTTYASLNAPEKVYLKTDKDLYINGDTIWFKTYILNGITHLPSQRSKVVYVEMLDANDSIVARRKLYTDFLAAPGDIKIADDTEEGTYLLRAYTKFMLNGDPPVYFQKKIPVWVQDVDPESISMDSLSKGISITDSLKTRPKNIQVGKPLIQFFPEGGNLVNGLGSSMGLKVTDKTGNGIALEGKIIDQAGTIVAPFRTYNFGLGVVRFTPVDGKTYYASIPFEGNVIKYEIPRSLPTGYVINVKNRGDFLMIEVSTNSDEDLNGTMLLGHLRGDLFFKKKGGENLKDNYTVKLLTSELDDGVAQFTLFTPDGEPVCERLVFIDNPDNDVALSVDADKKEYGLRKPVEIALELADKNGNTLEGEFSVGVVSNNGLKEERQDIKSWLLLDSDLGGTVEDPAYFFEDNSNARKYLLDILMMTHGWRRFVWKEMLAQKVTPAFDYEPEKGIMITGRTTTFENRYQPKRAMTTLSVLGKNVYQEKIATDLQGKFSFGPLVFRDSVDAIVNAANLNGDKKSSSDFSIFIDPSAPSIIGTDSISRKSPTEMIEYPRQFIETARLKKIADFRYDPRVTQLKEVVVKAKKKTRQDLIDEEINSMTLYGGAQNRLFPDSIPGTESASVLDLLRRVAGVQVFGTYPDQRVSIRGASGNPLFLMDGMPVDSSLIQYMQANEIMFVDVLKGPEGAIYGVRGGNGVVAVYSRLGFSFPTGEERYPGVTNFKVPGFYKAREFYSPNYAMSKPKHKKPDYRTTLHWEPTLEVKAKETSRLNFFTGDMTGKFVIKVEGITNDGRPVVAQQHFEVVAD